MPRTLISIDNACKTYDTPEGGKVNALKDINLNINYNEFVTLLGPSGCGKTTLLKTISGFESLDSGDIKIEGKSIINTPSYKRPVNTVFQNYALFPHMSVKKNITYGLDINKSLDKAEKDKKFNYVLNLINLEGFENRMPHQLSGGQQQRVALARAIINEPKILLLDEPLSALDKKLRSNMQIELKNIQNQSGISFIFVTHDQEEALSMSDRIIVMENGSVSQEGKPEEIYYQPKNKFTADFIGETNLINGLVEEENGLIKFKNESFEFHLTKDFQQYINKKVTFSIRPEQFFTNDVPKESNPYISNFNVEVIQKLFFGPNIKIVCKIKNQIFHCLLKISDQETIKLFEKNKKISIYFDVTKIKLFE
jgi:spermidine/putrescine transport system ATP-binding protein